MIWAIAIIGGLGWLVAVYSWRIARRWAIDCKTCRIIIARKGKVALDAPLVEWIAWNRALPYRERSRGGIIFMDRGIQVALARPKIGPPAASAKTSTVKETPAPAQNRPEAAA